VVLLLVDLALGARVGELQLKRRAPLRLSLGAEEAIPWDVVNSSSRAVAFEARDDLPEGIEALPDVEGRIAPRSRAVVTRMLRPTRRGRHELGDLHVRWRMPMGLLQRQRRLPAHDDVEVHPNVRALARFELATRLRRL